MDLNLQKPVVGGWSRKPFWVSISHIGILHSLMYHKRLCSVLPSQFQMSTQIYCHSGSRKPEKYELQKIRFFCSLAKKLICKQITDFFLSKTKSILQKKSIVRKPK